MFKVAFIFFTMMCALAYIYHDTKEGYPNPDNNKKIVRSDNHCYYEERCIIVEKGHNIHGNYFLIQRIDHPLMYTELNSYNWSRLKNVYGSPIFYSKKVGDTLYFEYILKNRFWKK